MPSERQRINDAPLHNSLLFLLDCQNIFFSVRDAYGVAARVDFRKLRDLALNGRRFKHIMSIAYLASTDDEIPVDFVNMLERLSYEVKRTTIRVHEYGEASATNIDSLLIRDALSIKIAGEYPEIVVVASGDADFIPVYQILRERGSKIEVLSFPNGLASELYNAVDRVEKLSRDHLFHGFDTERPTRSV